METLLLLAARGRCRATARGLCVQAVGGGLSGLAAQFSDDSALEVCILYYKIAQFVGNAVGVYTSGHTGAA